jgi:ribosomal protein RSM22 (predicted rRNA methylase)
LPRRTYQPLPLSERALACIERIAMHGSHADPRASSGRSGAKLSTQALAQAVAALSHLYTRDRSRLGELDATKEAWLARIGFFLPRDLPKVFGPLDELLGSELFRHERWQSERSLRMLDIGAGLGATSLGVARWLRLRALPIERLHVVALERNARALRSFQALASALSQFDDEFVPLTLDARSEELERAQLSERFDLITFGFVLNELFPESAPEERAARRAELLLRAAERLREGGAIIVLEPALRESARELMAVRDLLVARGRAPFVIAPCLHTHSCPMLPSERDWCHQELPYALPKALAEVAKAASLRYEGLSYASLVLSNTARPSAAANSFRIVSDRLESKGKLELFGCSEAGYVRLTRLTRNANERNAPFEAAQRGDVLTLSSEGPRVDEQTTVNVLKR